ncbi:hypothetical protein BKA83DRAFT_4168068, partial [Pisolithus microcarpus]
MAADRSSEKPGCRRRITTLISLGTHSWIFRTQAREDPSAVYTFDGERGIARTVICREPSSRQPENRQRVGDNTTGEQGKSRQKDCLALEMYSTQLFAAMQRLGNIGLCACVPRGRIWTTSSSLQGDICRNQNRVRARVLRRHSLRLRPSQEYTSACLNDKSGPITAL